MDNVLIAFVTTVKAEKQMRDLCIDLPDLSIQYESMLTHLKQHGTILADIRNALECTNVSEVDFQMDWITDMWSHISLYKYKVSITHTIEQTVEVWATDEANAKTTAAAIPMYENNSKEVNTSYKVEEVGK